MELKLLRVALTKCANVRLNARFGGILLTVTLLTSCATSWTKLGSLTMVATRNIDSKTEYKELARYVEGVDKGNYDSDKKKYKGTLSSAIDECVKEKKEADQKLIDEKKDEEDAKLAASFKIGDQVRFKNNPLSNNLTKGLVIGKKDTWNATIKYTNDKGEEKTKNIPFKELSKVIE
jgi:uncharacterized cupredoxin-like copper-binding protein